MFSCFFLIYVKKKNGLRIELKGVKMEILIEMYVFDNENRTAIDPIQVKAMTTEANHRSWKLSEDDISFLKLGHLMEYAFKTDKLYFSYTKAHQSSLRMQKCFYEKSELDSHLQFFVKTQTNSRIWKAEYFFLSKVKDFKLNYKPFSDKPAFNMVELKIIDKTEESYFEE